MNKYKKSLFFLFSILILQMFGLKTNSAQAIETIVLKTPAEVCLAFDSECDTDGENTDGSFVSGDSITINSAKEITLNDYYSIQLENLTLNLKTKVISGALISFSGEHLIINNLLSTDDPILSSNTEFAFLNLNVKDVTLNDLSISVPNGTILSIGLESAAKINGGSYKGKNIIELFDDSILEINDGSFEATSSILIDLHRAKEVKINNGDFKSVDSLISIYNYSNNLKIKSGIFEVNSENNEAQIFKVFGATEEETVKSLVANYIVDGSIMYDLANETKEISYEADINNEQDKGVKEFGYMTTKKIAVVAETGKGEEIQEEKEEVIEEELNMDELIEEEPTEENPDTLVDHPVLYFAGVILTTLGLVISAKKYLES